MTRRSPLSAPAAWARCALFCVAVAVAAPACATYRDDLNRSITHYDNREYDAALVLLEVVEPDMDSLSDEERAEYAYYRGMSHFLLEQRHDARHWLSVAAAREYAKSGVLRPDLKNKVDETLAELNVEWYGEASTPAAKAEAKKCSADGDCDDGQFCDAGSCKAPPADPAAEKDGEKKTGSKCETDANCKGNEVCAGGVCTTP